MISYLDLDLIIEESYDLDLIIEESHELDFDIGEVTVVGHLPWYEGDYTVTPKAFDETVLSTRHKSMRDDVTIEEIPYAETSNIYGTTVVIAS